MCKFTQTANRLKRDPKVKSIRLSGKNHLIIKFVNGTTNSLGKNMAGHPYDYIKSVLSMT
jgi:hypothetical protein